MLKKVVVIGVLLALTGCATHQQANTAVGAVTGAAIGSAVAGRGGAAVGAVLGAAVGSNQPTQAGTVYVERRPGTYIERQIVEPSRYHVCSDHRVREQNCYRLHYPDTRAMCIEDARKHYERCLYR